MPGCSSGTPVAVLQHGDDLVEFANGGGQFGDGVGGEFFRLGQVGGVFQRFVPQPLERVDLEVLLANLSD